MKNPFSLSGKSNQCMIFFTKHLSLVCFRGFVCFKLLGKAVHVLSLLCITTLKPCHWFILPEIKVTLMCIIQSHSFLAPTVQAGRHLYCCTVDMRRNFSMYYHLWEWELFINIPFYRQYSTMYLCVFFFCVKVSTLTILYICRWYELYVLGFIVCFVHDGLFAHLPLQLPSPQSILWWFYVMMMWTYQMKEHVSMQQASFELKCSILMRVFYCMQRGTLE